MVEAVQARRPEVPLVREVLLATFERHAYPSHVHDDWTVLLVDEGAVVYDLDRATHHAVPGSVTVLPPGVPHDGRTATDGRGYHKKVLYLDGSWLPPNALAATADRPTFSAPATVALVQSIHAALEHPGDALAAEHGMVVLREQVLAQLGAPSRARADVPLARALRGLLDDRLIESFTLAQAAGMLGAHPSHLVRSFSRAYGIAPHQYVLGRRIDLARRLLLDGRTASEAAVAAGFYDQAHLTRHFKRVLGVTPAGFAA
jgi:AraC-like DNA-binding protein